MKYLLLMTALSAIFLRGSLGKPTEIVLNSKLLGATATIANKTSEIEITRKQRSPQYGLLGDSGVLGYSDYDYNDDASSLRYGNRRKFYYKHRRPHGLFGGHGCRRYGCGGWQPDYGGHYGGQGTSFASASAGSIGGGGPYGGGQSQANAQSASFNIGPFSASFSAAQSSSGQNGFLK
ncbi:hypothetical protein PUN28_006499 [Cardiocondyla obscurior]|uniref:Glycine-rich protein n=1 Tax=Cardiocondyla obscurior TaxID=286306 RepID=A0AAW2G8Y3_9HYME